MVQTILLIGHPTDLQTTIKTLLEESGYEVLAQTGSDDCLQLLKDCKPDLVLL